MPYTADAPGRGRRRLLVVDDDPINRRTATLLLRRHPVDVVEVGGGDDALTALATGSFDLVLLDDRMPSPDGAAVAREIRRREALLDEAARIPIVAITASILPEDAARLLGAGVDEVLAKPLLADELDAALARWLPRQV